jgi:predicted ATP-grasp superfamily ATP-dependent carboligase
VTLASPLQDPAAYFAAIETEVRSRGAELLIPVGEAALRAILPRRRELPRTKIPFPDAEVFEAVSDKGQVLEAARRLGIPEPTFARADSPSELSTRLGELERGAFPLVLKPTRSVVYVATTAHKTSVRYVRSAAEIAGAVESFDQSSFPILLQRKVEGRGTGVFLLMWKGEVVAAFAHRRLREKPPSGGVSVLSESIPLSSELFASSARLLRALRWDGVAMVEYKENRVSGVPELMEVNGRFWGSLQLAIDSGVDFPSLLASVALGGQPAPITSYAIGTRTRWVLGDLDHLIARLTRSREKLGLGPTAPSRARAGVAFLRDFLPPVRSEVSRRGDRAPGRREAWRWIGAALGTNRG